MKIGILHLSDLHISGDSYLHRVDSIARAISFDVNQITTLFIVLSGDITNYGRTDEFEKAKEFITDLKTKVKPVYKLIKMELVIIPGNHDCCFDHAKSTRELIVNNCRKDVITEEDYFLDAVAVQENFWSFYKDVLEEDIEDKISFKRNFTPFQDTNISFHCYNSSWITEKNETTGKIVIPENKFLHTDLNEFTISVFHHPIEWLSPNTVNNNRQRFEEHLIGNSNIVLYGHEHDRGRSKNIVQKGNSVVFCGAKAFDIKHPDSGFAFYEIDLTQKSSTVRVYKWDTDSYNIEFEEGYTVVDKTKRKFLLNNEFDKKLNSLNIPLKRGNKELTLSDVFVYPDLEPLEDKPTMAAYPNSESIITLVKNNDQLNVLVEGAEQSGKTTLTFVYFKKLYDLGYTPIYVRGKDLSETNLRNIVKGAIREQYKNRDHREYLQQSKRVIFIDNLHKSPLTQKHKTNLLDSICSNFSYVFISSSNVMGSNIAMDETSSLKEFRKYRILPLGHEKRGELIEQWLRIGENEMTLNEERLLQSIKSRFNEIDSLIGNKLMPSYPVFILTLLQGLDSNIIGQDYSQTSYAHVYYALITAGLVREGIKENSLLTSYLNILKELAFYLFDKKVEQFNIKDFEAFYTSYGETYYKDFSSDKVISTLLSANILKYDDESYRFSYKYIFFYLVAQKISVKIDEYQLLIEELCEKIHVDRNANILIFLSHHTKAQLLIDNLIFTSQIPFENAVPISLDRHDDFVNFISEFTREIQNNIIEERDPKMEVKKDMQSRDKFERTRELDDSVDEDDKLPKEIIEINQAFSAIKIIGQIVKNQKGDFEKQKLVALVEAAYTASFRFVGFYSELLLRDKDSLIDAICEEINGKTNVDKAQIEKKVRQFFQYISWRICVDSFTSLMFSVGAKGRNDLYDAVADKMGSTSAKIVSFAIKTYYDRINVAELKQLFEETKNNYLAQGILQGYVKKHLYTNIIEQGKKDQIIQIAGLQPQKVVTPWNSRNNRNGQGR
jgi:hypothetical protein